MIEDQSDTAEALGFIPLRCPMCQHVISTVYVGENTDISLRLACLRPPISLNPNPVLLWTGFGFCCIIYYGSVRNVGVVPTSTEEQGLFLLKKSFLKALFSSVRY